MPEPLATDPADNPRIPLARPGRGASRRRRAEILRVDHAGEYAAVHIYRAQRRCSKRGRPGTVAGRHGRDAGPEPVHLALRRLAERRTGPPDGDDRRCGRLAALPWGPARPDGREGRQCLHRGGGERYRGALRRPDRRAAGRDLTWRPSWSVFRAKSWRIMTTRGARHPRRAATGFLSAVIKAGAGRDPVSERVCPPWFRFAGGPALCGQSPQDLCVSRSVFASLALQQATANPPGSLPPQQAERGAPHPSRRRGQGRDPGRRSPRCAAPSR